MGSGIGVPVGALYIDGQAQLKQKQSLRPRHGTAQEVPHEPDELAAQLQGEFGDEVKGMMGDAAGRANRGGRCVARDQFLLGDGMVGVEAMQ